MNSFDQRTHHQLITECLAATGESMMVVELSLLNGLSRDEVEVATEELVRRGQIERCRGRGRRVRLVRKPCGFEGLLTENHCEPTIWTREKQSYAAIQEKLQREWMPGLGFSDVEVTNTAYQGRRDTGGIWSRQDLLGSGTHPTLRRGGPTRHVVTFEVKLADQFDVRAIHEAHAQRIHLDASAAFLLVVVTESGIADALIKHSRRVLRHAKETNVGLVLLVSTPTDLIWQPLQMPREWSGRGCGEQSWLEKQGGRGRSCGACLRSIARSRGNSELGKTVIEQSDSRRCSFFAMNRAASIRATDYGQMNEKRRNSS